MKQLGGTKKLPHCLGNVKLLHLALADGLKFRAGLFAGLHPPAQELALFHIFIVGHGRL